MNLSATQAILRRGNPSANFDQHVSLNSAIPGTDVAGVG